MFIYKTGFANKVIITKIDVMYDLLTISVWHILALSLSNLVLPGAESPLDELLHNVQYLEHAEDIKIVRINTSLILTTDTICKCNIILEYLFFSYTPKFTYYIVSFVQ